MTTGHWLVGIIPVALGCRTVPGFLASTLGDSGRGGRELGEGGG